MVLPLVVVPKQGLVPQQVGVPRPVLVQPASMKLGRTLHRQITSSGHVRSIHQVAHVGIVVGWWQWGAGSVHVWLHCLRVVQSIACSAHRCAIRQVAHGIAEESTGQRRTRSVWIWSNGLRMVDGVASPVHCVPSGK